MGGGWLAQSGSTLQVPSGPAGNHLFVLILGPVAISGMGSAPQLAMVSFSTVRPTLPHDPACVVDVGDHSFIKHRSYAVYRDVRIERADHVQGMVAKGAWIPQGSCTPELLRKLRAGVCASNRVRREVKLLFGCP